MCKLGTWREDLHCVPSKETESMSPFRRRSKRIPEEENKELEVELYKKLQDQKDAEELMVDRLVLRYADVLSSFA